MTISKKVIYMTLISVLALFTLSYVFAEGIFDKSFSTIEEQRLERNVTRAINTLTIISNNLDKFTKDWAQWDETYQFAVDGNEGYVNMNLNDAFFEDGQLNLFAVLNSNRQLVYAEAYDLDMSKEIPVAEDTKNLLEGEMLSSLSDELSGLTGIVRTSEKAYLISAYPILTSYMEGPSTGMLIFGVDINATFINELSDIVQQPIEIYRTDDIRMPDDFQRAFGALSTETDTFIESRSNDYINGYSLINDITGRPVLVIKVSQFKDIYQQGQSMIVWLLIMLASICIITGAVFVYILKYAVFSRLSTISKAVSTIEKTGEISAPIQISGSDELTRLAKDINDMLARLNQTTMELSSQKTLNDRILYFSPNIVFVVDTSINIKVANRAFCELFNVSMSEVIGYSLSNFVAMEKIAEMAKLFADCGRSRLEFALRYAIRGVERTFEMSVVVMSQDEYLILGRDVTEENALRERLYLNDRLASVGEMAAGIAHELNNPLTGIIMLSQSIMQDDIPEGLKRDMNDINNEASRASEVVKNLLAFARKQPPAKRLTQINKLIDDVLSLRQYEQTVNNIRVVVKFDPDLPEIMVDSIQIQQVFLNLVLNAEYSMIHANNGGKFSVESQLTDGKIVVSFTDDGMGIKPEDMKKLFQPFFTTKEVGIGTGLGLSLCYGILNRHSGTITARSNWGHGATFTVELPVIQTDIDGNNNDQQ